MTYLSRTDLAKIVTGRTASMLEADVARHAATIASTIQGRRVLVFGGAGSIGAATVKELVAYSPRLLHVVDLNENALVEVVRDLRSDDLISPDTEFRLTPLDVGDPIMGRLLREGVEYDLVLNFAAVKHVRSERDVFSLSRMLEVNVLAAARLLAQLADLGVPAYFAVSTDKAANPVNIMGATKRAMELVMFDQRRRLKVTSARFANVAFSNGSLLDGWLHRLEKGQPWAVPASTRRFFVSPQESGQLCLLAATAAPDRQVVIPGLDPEVHLRDLVEVAEEVLAAVGLKAVRCHSEDEARSVMRRVQGTDKWPLLVTSLDTAGEKEFEEFFASDDVQHTGDFSQLLTLTTPRAEPGRLDEFLARATELCLTGESVASDDIIECVQAIVPGLVHRKSDLSLDARM